MQTPQIPGFTPKRPFVFVGGGLGDVARRFYLSDTYELLKAVTEPISVICYSHNPSALDFFRFHPNHRNLILFDVGHIYTALLRDPLVEKPKINDLLIALCGFQNADLIARRREPKPIGHFFAPDIIAGSRGHVVIHPFGRGWGDWPPGIENCVRSALTVVPASVRVFVICADYIAADGRKKLESFICDQTNVTVLRNLSAPAVFSLVATASRFIGSMSALAQVAAFEAIPSVILHPVRCSDFKSPYSDYSKCIWRSNGTAVPYDSTQPKVISEILKGFLQDTMAEIVMRRDFNDLAPIPEF
jgi:hypothetical protein